MAKLQKKSLAKLEEIRAIVSRVWGYENFRPMQEEIILSVLNDEDVLALMPTGGGKSLTFQVPALANEGICLVITPLIALMKDQVDQLLDKGIKAASLHSGMTRHEINVTLDNCIFGSYKFLYLSPERLKSPLFQSKVQDMNVNLLAVDEAHCISQWGYDFRPSYLEIRKLRDLLPGIPVLALTATATPEVAEDIQDQLGFLEKRVLKLSFNRENLTYVLRRTENKSKELLNIATRLQDGGIIYVRNRKKCREISEFLNQEGISSHFYHAGLRHDEREARQNDWISDRVRIMVATNAFGMGIDKSNVRFVIHVDLPDTPEAYFQEAGRAGRDGQPSWGILLYSPADKATALRRIQSGFPGIPKIRQVYMALCNFLQIPLGSGKGQQFDFDFPAFAERYKLNYAVAQSALESLAGEGYIALTDAMYNPSRLMFRASRDDLYSFQVRNESYDTFIKLLLRSYSGLFSAYTRIDEGLLARRSGLSRKKVYEYLKALSSSQIIHYIPRKDMPTLVFLEERLDDRNLHISHERYQFRKDRFESRIKTMIRYADSNEQCRNRFLLSYFGELKSPDCGRCDVCLARRKTDGSEEQKVRDAIRKVLIDGGLDLERLVDCLEMDALLVTKVLEDMREEGALTRGEDLLFRLN